MSENKIFSIFLFILCNLSHAKSSHFCRVSASPSVTPSRPMITPQQFRISSDHDFSHQIWSLPYPTCLDSLCSLCILNKPFLSLTLHRYFCVQFNHNAFLHLSKYFARPRRSCSLLWCGSNSGSTIDWAHRNELGVRIGSCISSSTELSGRLLRATSMSSSTSSSSNHHNKQFLMDLKRVPLTSLTIHSNRLPHQGARL